MAETYKQTDGQFHLWVHHAKVNARGEPVFDAKGNREYESEQRHSQTANFAGELVPHSSESVGIAYTQLEDRMHVWTHGTAEGMRLWAKAHNEHSEHKAQLKIFDQKTSLETLNRAIQDPVFFATLL